MITVVATGVINSSAHLRPHQHRHHPPMLAERESRPCSRRRRPPVNYRESDDDVDDNNDKDYDPHDDTDDDDYELPDLGAKQAQQQASQARYRVRHPDRVAASQARYLAKRSSARNIAKGARYRAKHPEKVTASKKKYRETHRDYIAEAKKCYRERHRARVAAASKRYRARHRERVAEYNKCYRERNRDRLAEYHKRYREKHRGPLAERQKRYRENNRGQILAYQQQYRETHRELLREKERRRYAGLGEDKRTAVKERRLRAHLVEKKRKAEKKRTAEKLNALGPLTLTIPLTDYLKSGHIPVTAYVKASCDSLESEDTNVSPTESFVQLLEEDSRTLIDLDSGAMQVAEPPDWDLDDLSFLQNISPDEWAEVLKDVEDSSSFDLETLVPPQGIIDLLEDMSPSSDEGVDLMYDLVS